VISMLGDLAGRALATVLVCAALAPPLAASALQLAGESGVPETIDPDCEIARQATEAALREVNVRVHHYCRSQGQFHTAKADQAARVVISHAEEVELALVLDGAHAAAVGMREAPGGKWALVSSRPYPCEIRKAAMTINDVETIEKHNADPVRTYDRASYKRFEGRTDAQIEKELLAKPLIPPDDAIVRTAVDPLPLEKRRGGAPGAPGASGVSLPSSYDVRTMLRGACDPTPYVRDQGSCASCWAQSNAEMLEDRICLATGGAVRVRLSTQQHTSCDKMCFPPPHNTYCNAGCNGGFQVLAGEYAANVGLVEEVVYPYYSGTGGSYEDHFTAGGSSGLCPMSIASHAHYKARLGSIGTVKRRDARSAQAAMVNGGSLDAAMIVYQEFFTYKTGIYKYSGYSRQAGGHAVKLIGYGTERGLPYWVAQNSWGKQWGEQGMFRIQRGSNEAGIEESIVFLEPDLRQAMGVLSQALVPSGEAAAVAVGHHLGSAGASGDEVADGFVEVTDFGRAAAAPALKVEANGPDGVTTIDTSSLAPGTYGVRYCAAGVCEPLDDKLTVSACPARAGLVCGGRGSCDEARGACTCDGGFGGAACEPVCGPMPELKCGCAHVGGIWDGMLSVTGGRGADALHSLTLTKPATVTISTCHAGTDLDTVVSVYEGCPLGGGGVGVRGGPPQAIAVADDDGCGADAASPARVPAGVTAGAGFGLKRGSTLEVKLGAGEFTVVVSGFDEHSIGDYEITVDGCAPEDEELGAGSARCPRGDVRSDSRAALHVEAAPVDPAMHAECLAAPMLDVGARVSGDLSAAVSSATSEPGEALFRLPTPRAGSREIVVSTCGSASDTELQVFRGCPAGGGHLLAASDDDCGLGAFVDVALRAGHAHFARVKGHMGVRGPFVVAAHAESSACAHAHRLPVNVARGSGAGGAEEAGHGAWAEDRVDFCAGGHRRDHVPDAEARGPDYDPDSPSHVYKLTVHEHMVLEVDACAAPPGSQVELYEGCAGEAGAMPLGEAAGGCHSGAGGGALLMATLGKGEYTVVVTAHHTEEGRRCGQWTLRARARTATPRSASAIAIAAAGGGEGAVACESHGACTNLARSAGETLFCAAGVCEPCVRCEYCADGVDNTCGDCPSHAYPTRDKNTCDASHLLFGAAAAPGDSGARAWWDAKRAALVTLGVGAVVIVIAAAAAALRADDVPPPPIAVGAAEQDDSEADRMEDAASSPKTAAVGGGSSSGAAAAGAAGSMLSSGSSSGVARML